ncbi:MAG: hypothetical protein AAGD25_29800 [Cyanobacteria bacterium P01_F01_bin.150]
MPGNSYPNIDSDFITYLNQRRSQDGLDELNAYELVCLSGALASEKQTYDVLGDKYSLHSKTLRQQASELWRWMGTIFRDYKITKPRLAHLYPELLAIARQGLAGGDEAYSRVLSDTIGLIPSTATGFYGRDAELTKIHAALSIQRVVNVYGIRGLGKRTFVAHYLKSKSVSLEDKKIAWIHQDLLQDIWAVLDGLDKPCLVVIEHGDVFRDDSHGLSRLKSLLGEGHQFVLISDRSLTQSWILKFPLERLSPDSAAQILAEFNILITKSSLWSAALESLGGIPAFIRQYSEWVVNVLGVDQEQFIARGTVQYGVIEPQLREIFQRYTSQEVEFLQFLARFEGPVDIVKILEVHPASATKLRDLCRAGLIDERTENGRKRSYQVPKVLKKYLLSEKD